MKAIEFTTLMNTVTTTISTDKLTELEYKMNVRKLLTEEQQLTSAVKN